MLRKTGLPLVLALSILAISIVAIGARPADAEPVWVVDANLSSGVDTDATAIGRLHAGGLLLFGRFGIDAQVAFSGFLRVQDSKGVEARSFSPLNLGVRYAFSDAKFEGPYVALGGGFGFLSGKPRERKVEDTNICASATNKQECSFDIKQQLNARIGLGWGFRAGKSITVAVRLDLTYFAFNVVDGEDQPAGAPNPRDISRPVDSVAVLIGLEFLRWM